MALETGAGLGVALVAGVAVRFEAAFIHQSGCVASVLLVPVAVDVLFDTNWFAAVVLTCEAAAVMNCAASFFCESV